MPDIRSTTVRDDLKLWLGATGWSDIFVGAIDKGERNTVAVFGSTPTTAVGYKGRAEQTLYYSSGTLLAAHREATRQGHRFRNRLAEELSSDIASKTAEDSALKATIEVLSRLNPTNEWRQLRSEIERRAELQRAAAQILDSLLGGERERRTTGQLGESKLVVFVGDGGGGVRKGSRGPNPSNRLVRELQLEAQARGIDARFVLTPETLTSQRCSKPWCVDAEGRRSKASIMQYEDGEACFAVLRCETCRVIVNRDAGGGANIMNQGVSYIWHDEPMWRSKAETEQLL